MSRLLYNSAQDTLVTRADLGMMTTPPPMGSRHNPVPFGSFADKTVDAITAKGLQVKTEEFAVTKDGMRMFGLLEVSNPHEVVPTEGKAWSLLVALRAAHDQRISRGLAIGSQVMVCSNLCFHGDLGNWHTKQTTNINDRLPSMLNDAMSGIEKANNSLQVDFDAFNNRSITRERGDALLLSIFRDDGLSASQLGRAVDDWTECGEKQHTANGRNLWWLFNSATYALKPTGANNNHDDLRKRSTVVYGHLQGEAAAVPLITAH